MLPAFCVPTPGQSASCFVPPSNALSDVVFWASSRPVNAHPLTDLLDRRSGALPVQVVGSKLFQSKEMFGSATRFPSLSSKPAAVPTGPMTTASTALPTGSESSSEPQATPIVAIAATASHLTRLLIIVPPPLQCARRAHTGAAAGNAHARW